MRKESGSDAVLEADLGILSSSDGGDINMSGQEEIPVNKESSAGDSGDSGQCGALSGENGGFHSLGFAHSFAETPFLC